MLNILKGIAIFIGFYGTLWLLLAVGTMLGY
jgi:hypothetical protein